MRVVRMCGALLVLLLGFVAGPAHGQLSFWIDGGTKQNRYDNGEIIEGLYGGMGMSGVLSGFVGETFSLVFPASFEGRWGQQDMSDLAINADAMLRVAAIALGAGLDFRMPGSPRVPDLNGDTVIVNDVQMFGYSGSGRLNFGPQGRMFLQGRYSIFPKEYGLQLIDGCASEYVAESARDDCYSVQGLGEPPFAGAKELRLGGGYVFPASLGALTLRVQLTQQRFDYVRVDENTNGAYSRNSDYLTLGIVYTL